MPRTVENTVYQFDELSDEAKERAREWWREHDDFSYEATYDDADEIAARLGISIARKSVPLVSGKTRQEPEIYFSGFWSPTAWRRSRTTRPRMRNCTGSRRSWP